MKEQQKKPKIKRIKIKINDKSRDKPAFRKRYPEKNHSFQQDNRGRKIHRELLEVCEGACQEEPKRTRTLGRAG